MEKVKYKILLAEDDKFLSIALGDKLEREGFIAIKAPNGLEALGLIRSEKPDLILLDLIMPQRTGFQVLEELKKDAELAKIPVVVLSNLGQEPDREKAKALGAVDYLVKSDVQMGEVVEKLKTYLK
ncbi:MAG: response regulator [Patescibacteria group bacterium]